MAGKTMNHDTSYIVKDLRTGATVGRFISQTAARRKAERLDLTYGAYRYSVELVDNRAVDNNEVLGLHCASTAHLEV